MATQPLRINRNKAQYARHDSSSSFGSSGPSPSGRDSHTHLELEEPPSASTIGGNYPSTDDDSYTRPNESVVQMLARGLSMSAGDQGGFYDDDDDDFDFEAKLEEIRPVSEDGGSPPPFGSTIAAALDFLKAPPPLGQSRPSPSPSESDPMTPRAPQSASYARVAQAMGGAAPRSLPRSEPAWKFPPSDESAAPSRSGSVTPSRSSSTTTSPVRYQSLPSWSYRQNPDGAAHQVIGSVGGVQKLSDSPNSVPVPLPAHSQPNGSGFNYGVLSAPIALPYSAPVSSSVAAPELPSPLPISSKDLLAQVQSLHMDAIKGVLNANTFSKRRAAASAPGHSRNGSMNSNGSDDLFHPAAHHQQPSSGSIASLGDSLSIAPSSTDHTLDLSHQRIAEASLTREVVEELNEFVERLALGYNHLPVLPDHFAILGSKLRYLNLRGNHMEVFPEVLCQMPSLEILDVSRNKIRAFPRRPGTMDRLAVLSLSRNRIRRLPNYFADLQSLTIFKIDHNPVVYPPREIVSVAGESSPEMGNGGSPAQPMGRPKKTGWLIDLQAWMKVNPYVSHRSRGRASNGTGDDARTRGDHRTLESLDESPTQQHYAYRSPLPPSPAPVLEERSAGYMSPLSPPRSVHGRNASATMGTQPLRKRLDLRGKKSLPDLRRNHGEIVAERTPGIDRTDARDGFRTLSPVGELASPLPIAQSSAKSPVVSGIVRFNDADVAGHDRHAPGRQARNATSAALQGDRNSGAYFRRHSMLPASSISKEIPLPLLRFVDAIRGVLFSLSQIYAALKQFVTFASSDGVSTSIGKVMNSADASTGKLIDCLDRFDSLSRKGTPDAALVRDVFVTARENVATFGQLTKVMNLQLHILVGPADVRYSRTMLLSLYGALVEIAMSWSNITPLVEDVFHLLHPEVPPEATSVWLQPPTPSSAVHDAAAPSAGVAPAANGSAKASALRPNPTSPPGRPKARRHAGSFSVEDVNLGAMLPPASALAESFPSAPLLSPPQGPAASLRAVPEQPSSAPPPGLSRLQSRLPRSAVPASLGLTPATQREIANSVKHLPPSPFGPPPSFPSLAPPHGPSAAIAPDGSAGPSGSGFAQPYLRPSARGVGPAPGASRTDVDCLDMARAATDIAFSVTTMMMEALTQAVRDSEARTEHGAGAAAGSGSGTTAAAAYHPTHGTPRAKELMELCEVEMDVTRRLRMSLTRIRGLDGGESSSSGGAAGGAISPGDGKKFHEDATVFVKTVIQMAGLARAAALDYPLSLPIRNGLGQLTKATQELTTLLAVSSFHRAPASSASHPLGLGLDPPIPIPIPAHT